MPDVKVVVVTDPMCSWCWGMSPAVEEAAANLAGVVEFDLLLGGINTTTTRPVGEYARRYLMRVWREVQATTGQSFSFRVPDGLVYNSTAPCLALAAVRRASGRAPFGYLHRLQQLLFVEARDINDAQLLATTATEFGVAADVVRQGLADAALAAALRAELNQSRRHGTSQLPHVLIEQRGERSLLAGGYVDGPMLEALIRGRLEAGQVRK